jgi:hypothetical protein
MGGIPITRQEEDRAIQIIQRAFELGINFFDSATGYGLGSSERRIGKAVKEFRDEVIIATKTGSMNEKGATRSLEAILKQLDTDYIDLWQLGNVTTRDKYNRLQAPEGAYWAAERTMDEGIVKHVGISTHSMDIALDAVSSGLFETIQYPVNLIADEGAKALIPLAKLHDMGFIAMKPFAAGLIEDAGLAMKFLLNLDYVIPNPGIETMKELEEIVNIVNGSHELTSRENQEIAEIRESLNNRFCRHCEACMPCPKGVHIPPLLYTTAAHQLRSPEWFLKGLKTDLKTWDNCTKCGECEEKCPYGLPILEMITENIGYIGGILGEYQ